MKTKITLTVLLFMACFAMFGQDGQPATSIGEGTYLGKSIPLRDFPLMQETPSGKRNYKIIPNNFPVNGYEHPNSLPIGGDPIRQSEVNIANQMRNLELSFDGPNAAQGQATPPDPSGAVGPNHYAVSYTHLTLPTKA